MNDRTVLKITGADRVEFLQGLITNDVAKADGGIVYAALLTPQGKYLADFFVVSQPEAILIDVASALAPSLVQRLTMYRLRADVGIEATDLVVSRGLDDAPDGALPDPRHPDMGWRAYGDTDLSQDVDWISRRISAGVPASGVELTPDSYILEMGFERLNGVDFKKGCFVGQEVVARMKHKTTLRKGLAVVRIDGQSATGSEISADGKTAGTLHSQANGLGLAYLRYDRANAEMSADGAKILLERTEF